MLRVFLVLVYCFYIVSSNNDIGTKLDSMDKKLDAIQEKVETIADAMTESKLNSMDMKLDNIQQKLEIIAAHVTDSQGSEETNTERSEETNNNKPIKKPPSNKENTIVLTEASREKLNDEVKFSIKFSAGGDRAEVHWWNTGKPAIVPAEGQIAQRLDDGTWINSIVFPTPTIDESSGIVIANIQTSDYDEATEKYSKLTELSVQFDSYWQVDKTQTEFSIMPLEIEPPGDVIYQEGQDVDIKLTATNKTDYDLTMSYIDLESDDYVYLLMNPKDEVVELLSEEENDGLYIWHSRVKTSHYATSGYLHFQSTSYTPSDDDILVTTASIRYIRNFRPANQVGPFPPNYLGFLKQSYSTFTGPQPDGSVKCTRGHPCIITCMAIGEDITDVELRSPDNTEIPLQFRSSIIDVVPRKGGVAIVSQDSSDVDGNVYQCLAKNREGKQISKSIEVSLIVTTEILRDRSHAEIVEETATSRVLNVTCTAVGMPPLTVNFNVYLSAYPYYKEAEPDQVVYLGDNEIAASMTLSYNTSEPDVYSYGSGDNAKPTSVSCIAQSGGNGGNDGNGFNVTMFMDTAYYDIPMPED